MPMDINDWKEQELKQTVSFESVMEMNTYAISQLMNEHSEVIEVDPNQSLKYIGRFDEFLAEHNIPSWAHYMVTLVNGLLSPLMFKKEVKGIWIVNMSKLNEILRLTAKK